MQSDDGKFVPLIRHHKDGTFTIAGKKYALASSMPKNVSMLVRHQDNGFTTYRCESCHRFVDKTDSYCRKCGSKFVSWRIDGEV